MKTVKFQGVEYEVPDWANWITMSRGNISVWETEPVEVCDQWWWVDGEVMEIASIGSPTLKEKIE